MVSTSYRISPSSGSRPGSNQSPMVAVNNAKPSSSRTRAPWPLETFWSSSSKKSSPSPTKSRSPISSEPRLAQPSNYSYNSSTGVGSVPTYDFIDLPLTPPDSGDSAFELHASHKHGGQRDSLLVSTADSASSVLRDEQIASPQKVQSKNDIFNSPISWLTPPARLNPVASVDKPQPPPSKNSLLFSSFGSSSPAPPSPPPPPRISSSKNARPSTSRADDSITSVEHTSASGQTNTEPSSSKAPESQQVAGRKKGHSRNSSLGRASSEECLQEEARIRSTKHVHFRLCPANEFLLGEGRHCSVYLGSYRHRHDAQPADTASPIPSDAWRLCAIKRLHADRQSQLLGLEEAFALRRLGLHPNVIQLIDIRDEVEFATSPQPTPQPKDQHTYAPSAGLGLGLGLPRFEGRGAAQSGRPSTAGQASHSRSTSDMTGRDEILHEAQYHKRVLAHEKQHEAALARGILHEPDQVRPSELQHRTRLATAGQNRSSILPNPTFLVQIPDGDALDSSRNASKPDSLSGHGIVRRPSGITMKPPRLLILLELLPNNLALFAKKHAERIDLQQWFDWAIQMSEAIVFLHDKGCVHADIKKENMLLTENLNIKLCDFNSAVFPNPNDPPRDGLGLGTPAYCAPELSRATGGPGATTFSYPIDIFSLGAVLYSLATGYEPFSKARSVVEMLHRKRLFFDSEENDRASRLAVEAGSNPNSQPASRSGSLRGRHQHTSSSSATANDASAGLVSPSQLTSSLNRVIQYGSPNSQTSQRDASNDSLESVASSITTISGRNPTFLAVSRLLEPTDEPRGLLVDPSMPTRQGSLSLLRDLNKADVRRTASTGGRNAIVTANNAGLQRLRGAAAGPGQQDEAAAVAAVSKKASLSTLAAGQRLANLEVAASSRPEWLRRRSSYGDEVKTQPAQYLSPAAPIAEATTPSPSDTVTARGAEEPATTPTNPTPSRLRSMFSPTSASLSATDIHPSNRTQVDSDVEDARGYADGHPAINLPGGGRLPDWARELLRSMLEPNPAARPTAQQVRQRLREGIRSAQL